LQFPSSSSAVRRLELKLLDVKNAPAVTSPRRNLDATDRRRFNNKRCRSLPVILCIAE